MMIVLRLEHGQHAASDDPGLTLTATSDPVEAAEMQERLEQDGKNRQWLAQQWPHLLPTALGKYVGVAGQEAFVADTLDEALRQAREAHPEDRGALVQYVLPHQRPRIYAHQG